MALDEQSWHEAWDALAGAVGAEAAATLMGAWPRDVARRGDIYGLDAKIDALDARITGVDGRLDAVAERLDAKVDAVAERLDAKVEAVAERLDAKVDATQRLLVERIERSEAHLVAVMRGELNAQIRSLMFGFVGLQATIGAFVIGFVRFAV